MSDSQSHLFGKLALEAGYITPAQLKECIAIQDQYIKAGKKPPRLGDILEKKGFLTAEQRAELLSLPQHATQRLRFGETAVQHRFCGTAQVDEALRIQQEAAAQDKHIRVGEILVQKGYLKPHQVEVVLQRQKLSGPPPEPAELQTAKSGLLNEQDLKQGRQIGTYELKDDLGVDRYGRTVLGYDFKRQAQVAIRVIGPAYFAEKQNMLRLRDNLKALKDLNHPRIRQVLAFERIANDTLLILDYIDGQSAYQWVQSRGPLPWVQAVQWILQALDALRSAQSKGIIHGDIRPSNLMIRNGAQQIVVNNFGLFLGGKEHLLQPAQTEQDLPVYLAPEEALQREVPDHRSDIYSLGMTLYYLIAGRPLLSGKTPLEALLKLSMESLPTLSQTGKIVPPELDDIFTRMINPEPGERYASYDELEAVLKNLLSPQAGGDAAPAAAAKTKPAAGTKAPAGKPVARNMVKAAAKPVDADDSPELSPEVGPVKRSHPELPTEEQIIHETEPPKRRLTRKHVLIGGGVLAVILVAVVVLPSLMGGKEKPKKTGSKKERGQTTVDWGFVEPGGEKANHDYYARIAASDPDPERQEEARRRQQIIVDEVEAKGQAELAKIQAKLPDLLEKQRYSEASKLAAAFHREQFFTPGNAAGIGAVDEQIRQSVEQTLQSALASVEQLVNEQKFAEAEKSLDVYARNDYPPFQEAIVQAKSRIAELRAAWQQEQERLANEAKLRESEVAWNALLTDVVKPGIRAMQFTTVIKELEAAKSGRNSKLAQTHQLLAEQWLDTVKQYAVLTDTLTRHNGKLKSTVTVQYKDVEWIVAGIGKNSTWDTVVKDKKRVSIPWAELAEAENDRILGGLLALTDPAVMRTGIQYLIAMESPVAGASLYDAWSAAGNSDAAFQEALLRLGDSWFAGWLASLSEGAESLPVWLASRELPLRVLLRSEHMTQWRDRYTALITTSLGASEYEGKLQVMDFSGAPDSPTLPIALGNGTVANGVFSAASPVTIEWNDQHRAKAVRLLFRFTGSAGSMDVKIGDVAFSVTAKTGKPASQSTRVGTSFLQHHLPLDLAQWHWLSLRNDAGGMEILLDGAPLVPKQAGKSAKNPCLITLSGSAEMPVLLDDVVFWSQP